MDITDADIFTEWCSFPFTLAQKERFGTGELRERWYYQNRELFDSDDVRVARTNTTYHFYEWLAALLICKSTGYLSLVESYEYKTNPEKLALLSKILPPNVEAMVRKNPTDGTSQCPDLLCYAPDYSNWFFCEVKGPTDSVKNNQRANFKRLVDASGKLIRVFRFNQL